MSLYNKYKSIIDNFISNDINNINNYNVKDPLISIIILYSLDKNFELNNKDNNKNRGKIPKLTLKEDNDNFIEKTINPLKHINNKIITLSLLIESVITLIKDYTINIYDELHYIQKLMKYNQLIINIYSEIVRFINENNFYNFNIKGKCYNGFLIINNTFDILNDNILKSNISIITYYQTLFEMSFLLIWNLIDNNIDNMINYKLTGNYLGILYKIYIDIDEQDNLDVNLNMFKLNDPRELMDYYMKYQEYFLNYILKIKLFDNEELIDEILNHLGNNINLIS